MEIELTVWPIAAECVAAQTKAFGAAYGFDHQSAPTPGKMYKQNRDNLPLIWV